MVKIYIARQPILDREGRIFAYELLFRSGFRNRAEIIDSKRATAKVIESVVSSFNLKHIIRDKKGFINIDENTDILEAIEILPPDRIGFEILESSLLSGKFLDTLKRLKELGYELSLDDFVYSEDMRPYLDLVDYVKIDVLDYTPEEVYELTNILSKHDVKLIAEKVESYEIYETYYSIGFNYFQGYFFQKPRIIASKTVEPAYADLVRLYNLVAEEKDISEIERVFKHSSELSLKLIQLINSAYYSLRQPVKSIRHAILMLGYKNLLRWILILMYSVRSEDFNSDPLFEEASIRGFFMEEVTGFLEPSKDIVDKAFITGILSLVDVLMGVPMDEVVKNLSLEQDIKNALLHRKGELGQILSIVESTQLGNLSRAEEQAREFSFKGLTTEKLLALQTEAIESFSKLDLTK